ncbi:serine-rich adhesin for platelets isoform X2 [Polyergus mexicanus]|uniref:serine-rich adhesin for platelets isoform X2 n=1 Tax=Polyergus mexicanus TaxID=615972 RepID=UPI0038B43AF9
MAAPQASSRLEMLQARFQQKQLQEKEQKLLQLYDQQQQRAYQVVQRGSAGSNSSNHGGSIATRTTTHTTSTSQGGKVRQMFDERRQTTVKGIDRSYPLEPLENKSRKQTNTNGSTTQRNGNSTMNRQSVNVKRVTRADVNSNVNGGKPVVSYHEEIMRESFGPSVRRHDDEDEFGVEDRVATFANGYYRHEADNEQEEVLDRETVERNRMMAKIHLMEYDDSLKHHARNDLENEEFPEYLMVNVPDRLPKRNVAKKLSQAEARLERFKNTNAKRSNMSKQLTSTSNVIKKRSERTIPTKSNSGRSEIAGTSPTGTRSGSSRMSNRSRRILENVKNFLPSETRVIGKISKRKRRENSDTETFNQRDSPRSFFEKPIKAENISIYPRKALNGFKSLTADGKIFVRRGTRPQFFCKESERSGTTMSIDRKSNLSGSSLFDRETLIERSKSPYFFLDESEQSRTSESKSPIWEREILSGESTSPQYFRESKRSETTTSSDRETIDRGILKKRDTINLDKKLQTSFDQEALFKSPSYEREILKKRNTSPQFFCKESERSATTMSIDRKSDSSESPLFYQKTLTKQSKSPHFFLSESEQSRATSEFKSSVWEREISSRQSTSPQYPRYEFKRSETAMNTDRETTGSKSSEWNKKILAKRDIIDFDKKLGTSDTSFDGKTSSKSPLYEGGIFKKRDTSPRFFCKESERSGTTISIDSTVDESRSPSGDREIKQSASPQYFCKESERSGTTMSTDREINKPRSPSYDKKILKQSTTPQLSSRKTEKLSTISTDRQYDESKSSGTIREKREKRTASPQFFCKESEKSATTMLIEPRSSSTDSTKNILKKRSYTPDISYKRIAKPLSSINKINLSQDRRSPNPSIIKHEAKKALKTNEIPGIVTESRRSSRISEISAASTSSIVSLKYGLEFDNILQSAGLVRKFMKSQNEKQREVRESSKQNIKNVNASIAKDNQSRIRCKTSSSFQKASSPSIENRRRATPESPRKSITPIEVDMDIQEIVMTDHRIESDRLQKAASPISRRQIDATYTKSLSDKTKLKTSVTYPVGKMQKQRASILKSNVFESKEESLEKSKGSKNHPTYRDSEGSAINLNKLGCNPVSETSQHIITRPKEDENRASTVKISQTQEQAWNKSVRNQAERTALRSKKREDRRYTTPRSPKQTRDRSTGTRISKAMSPDSSKKEKYSDDIVLCLRSSEEQSGETRTEFNQLRSLQPTELMQDTLKKKNLSASDEYNRKRTEKKNENVAIDEVDAGIDVNDRTIVEIALNEKIKDYRKITHSNSTDQSIDKDIILRGTRASTASNSSKEIRKECSRQRDVKSRILPRVPLLRKTIKISRDANISKVLPSQKVTSRMSQNATSKFLRNIVKDNKDRSALIAKKSTNLFNKTNVKHKIEKSEDTARKFSKILTRQEDESEKDFERMDSVESALRRFDSIGAEFEHSSPTSFRASPEISLQVTNVQTKSSVKQTITSEEPMLISSPDVINNTILKSTPKSPVNKDLKAKSCLRKSDLKIPGKEIYSSKTKRLEKKIGNSIQNKKLTQTRSPMCKRRLFESDSEKEIQESNYSKTRKKENYSSVSFRFHKDKAVSKIRSSKNLDREDAKESKGLQETRMFSVKSLRSIEDIRKSIDKEQDKIITAKESRSAIANRRSVSRQDVDARRSISAAAKNVFLGDDLARLTKAKSCVSRITKSPSPDSATRKHHETNTRATRRSAPSSPSKSPDIASKCASTEPKNQEAKPSRKSAITKGADSTGSKAVTNEVVDTIDGVALQNGSLYESTTKKSDAFIIDSDDQSAKEGDIVPSKKSPIKKSYSNKQQTASSASNRPTSSNSNASLTHGQVSSTKSKMTTRAKTPASAGPQAKSPFSARSSGISSDLVACKICGRTFANDRISYHEKVCTKVVNMKRKKFDAMTFRIRGTELEPFAKKSLKKQETKKPQVKSDWRRKHEDFINTIRSAKQLQAYLAAGGSLKDLPPPPPSDTSDYIQCPHCNRKFNQAAAERHIPKCETMLHNKPAHLRASKPRR